MPSVSDKQEKFMSAVAHSPEFAKKVGVDQSVGKEFNDADQAQKPKKKKKPHEVMYKSMSSSGKY